MGTHDSGSAVEFERTFAHACHSIACALACTRARTHATHAHHGALCEGSEQVAHLLLSRWGTLRLDNGRRRTGGSTLSMEAVLGLLRACGWGKPRGSR